MGDMLSKDFSRAELACPDCGSCLVTPDLVNALQALRDLAQVPIHVDSGYRCPAHNASVGGVSASQHTEGKAADIRIDGLNVHQMYVLACEIPAFNNGGIGLYDGGFIHVDVRGTRARWSRIAGKYGPVEAILNADWAQNSA